MISIESVPLYSVLVKVACDIFKVPSKVLLNPTAGEAGPRSMAEDVMDKICYYLCRPSYVYRGSSYLSVFWSIL